MASTSAAREGAGAGAQQEWGRRAWAQGGLCGGREGGCLKGMNKQTENRGQQRRQSLALGGIGTGARQRTRTNWPGPPLAGMLTRRHAHQAQPVEQQEEGRHDAAHPGGDDQDVDAVRGQQRSRAAHDEAVLPALRHRDGHEPCPRGSRRRSDMESSEHQQGHLQDPPGNRRRRPAPLRGRARTSPPPCWARQRRRSPACPTRRRPRARRWRPAGRRSCVTEGEGREMGSCSASDARVKRSALHSPPVGWRMQRTQRQARAHTHPPAHHLHTLPQHPHPQPVQDELGQPVVDQPSDEADQHGRPGLYKGAAAGDGHQPSQGAVACGGQGKRGSGRGGSEGVG